MSSRRSFLRGLGGVTVGLPFLESLGFSRRAHAQSGGSAPRRFVTFFQCNGANMDRIWPDGSYGGLTASHFEGTTSLAPLARHRGKLLIPRNMVMTPWGFGWGGPNGDDHQKGCGQKLTAQPLDGANFATGISIDQFIAQQVNPGGRDPLTLGVHRVGGGGTGSISYRGPSQPVTSEANPRLTFQDLMGIVYDDNAPVRNLLVERRKSVLDLVRADFETLEVKSLSKSDRDKLDLHFSTIRDLEQQLDGMNVGTVSSSACTPLDAARVGEIQSVDSGADVYGDASFADVGRMQMDLIALALACDHTRVATLQWGSGAGGPIFTWDGMGHTYNHHKLSHGNTRDDDTGSEVPGWELMIAEIDRWFAGEFAYLLDRLDAYDEGDATLLDNTVAWWINELSHGQAHDFRDLPCVLAGSCGGALKQGEYLNLSDTFQDTRNEIYPGLPQMQAAQAISHNKLLTTFANIMGATEEGGGAVTHFGSPDYGDDGAFDQLLA